MGVPYVDDKGNPMVEIDGRTEGTEVRPSIGPAGLLDRKGESGWVQRGYLAATSTGTPFRTALAVSASTLRSDNREGLPDGHAYTVLGFDPATDTVELRNPHARNEHEGPDGQPLDGKEDGRFTPSMEEFDRLFSNVAYGGAPFASKEGR
ncbi:MAG: hypothetical protein R3F61_25060 [Myxococcota bacterium]